MRSNEGSGRLFPRQNVAEGREHVDVHNYCRPTGLESMVYDTSGDLVVTDLKSNAKTKKAGKSPAFFIGQLIIKLIGPNS